MNIALITARGGSKGLPRKNIRLINGKPLIVWTIEAALRSKNIHHVYVTTEDREIAEISCQYGATVIPRPEALAQDTTSSEPVILHALQYLSGQNVQVENLCLLQPTSPLRNQFHIDEAFHQYSVTKALCVLSVFEPKHSAAKSYKLADDGSLSGLLFDDAPYSRRQDLPVTYQPNGAIYLFSTEAFLQFNQIPRRQVYPYVMREMDSVDIDELNDLYHAEKLLQRESNDNASF